MCISVPLITPSTSLSLCHLYRTVSNMPSPAAKLALIILAVLVTITLIGIALRTQIDSLVKLVQRPDDEITTTETTAGTTEAVQTETAKD